MSGSFTMVSGDTKNLVVTVKDESDVVVDLTASTINWALARSVHAAIEITKTIGSGIVLTDAVNGEFTVTIDPADTAGMIGNYFHEAELIDANGDVSTVLSGSVVINKDLID